MVGMVQGDWKKAVESQTVVGRFIEVEIDDPVLSKKEGRVVMTKRVLLEAKVAGSADISTQRVKPFNEMELRNRFPGAWESFIAKKGDQVDVPVPGQTGMPIDRADFVPAAKRAALKETGITTVEMLAAMSDGTVQDWGPGARTWRKKAAELLAKG